MCVRRALKALNEIVITELLGLLSFWAGLPVVRFESLSLISNEAAP